MNTPTSLGDRYLLSTHLARGGMADVYQGQDELLGRKVAVKVLHAQYSTDDAFVKRFRKEAQAAANLTHPNIVGIYDWGQIDSTYYIVMELVDGRSLREVLKSEGALLPRRAIEISADVAAALSVAHRSGLVHRDIKPGNILLAPDGTVKVTDFGIARAWDDSQELTKTGAVMGTATYFSPEQAQGATADERSDVYSLGVVLYEMLTGTPPFRGDSPMAVAFQHVSQNAAPPSTVNPDVPAELDRIVMKAMAKDPAQRYQTAEALRTDLWRTLQGEPPAAASQAPAPAPDDQSATRTMAPVPPATVPPDQAYRSLEEPPSTNLAFVVGTFALLATLAVLVFLVLRQLSGPDTPVADLIAVEDVSGLTEEDALRAIQAQGLVAIPNRENSDAVDSGLVIRTDPAAGSQVEEGATVTVIISAGIEQFPVPSLVGLDQTTAVDLILRQGFQLGQVIPDAESTAAPGTVISQEPLGNVTAPAGATVDIVVAAGPETVALSDLTDLTERDATAALQSLGLFFEIQTEFSDEVDRGRVIRTTPDAGVELAIGATVTLVVSDGPEPVVVPSLIGLTLDAALTRLEQEGLVLVQGSGIEVSNPEQVGRVVEQNPGEGANLLRGDSVLVRVGVAPPPTTTTTATTVP
jgi:beta-lactam-binding protein with PASTA domain/tRNA A-37 threonylcarbamoyl transferase component Bud32